MVNGTHQDLWMVLKAFIGGKVENKTKQRYNSLDQMNKLEVRVVGKLSLPRAAWGGGS